MRVSVNTIAGSSETWRPRIERKRILLGVESTFHSLQTHHDQSPYGQISCQCILPLCVAWNSLLVHSHFPSFGLEELQGDNFFVSQDEREARIRFLGTGSQLFDRTKFGLVVTVCGKEGA